MMINRHLKFYSYNLQMYHNVDIIFYIQNHAGLFYGN